jgi:hypothetical protein
MEVKNLPKLIGDLSWSEYRNLLVIELLACQKEEELTKIISNILASCGPISTIIKTRKALGIKPLTKDEIEGLK